MDKQILIRKEIKDNKLYLNELYESLKKTTSKKKQKELMEEINAITEVKNTLSNLINEYEKGTGDIKLEELTKINDKEFEKYQFAGETTKIPNAEECFKIIYLKSSLDIINENYLSKQEIYEYLNDYNEVMKIARSNIKISIKDAFYTYMNNTNQFDKANSTYYYRMIKIHILFVNLSILSVIKDEDFEHLWSNDAEMAEKAKVGELAFLKDKFIIPTDSTRFKKTHIFNYIRNAFFHSDTNELYKITLDCNHIKISLQKTNPIPFNVKVTASDIFRMTRFIKDYSHNVTAYEVENQSQIIVDNLSDHYHKCSRELNKVSLVKKILPSTIQDRKGEINSKLNTSEIIFSSEAFNKLLNSYGEVQEIKYKLSEPQKRLLHQKFKHFSKNFKNIDMKFFVVPIISNYMPIGINKVNFLNFDAAINYTYLFDYNYSIYHITHDIVNDYHLIANNQALSKKSVFDYINKNVDLSKHELLYLFDFEEQENYNDILLFKYVLGTIYNDELINIAGTYYPTDRIRNALTHNRWRASTNERGKRCFYLYDDENMLVDPENANNSNTFWSATFLYEDLKQATDNIINSKPKKLIKK